MSTEAAETTSTRYCPPTLQPAVGLDTVPRMDGVSTKTWSVSPYWPYSVATCAVRLDSFDWLPAVG
jgi:hypothetical protein